MDILFPSGSLEMVSPTYEHGVITRFYNGCIQAAFRHLLERMPSEQEITMLELGAGVGATSQSVLPVVQGRCEGESACFVDVAVTMLHSGCECLALV